MANIADVKSKEVKLVLADGVERSLKYDLNALAELEERYGTVEAAFEALDKNSIKAVRCVLWAGLIHDEPTLTEQQVGSLMDVQSMQSMMETMATAFNNDLPQDKSESPN